ncbi:MAG: hypothetical protein K2X39_03065 [Silvanigrellaceae bacterium]|nr:hypothetical protein [Silvanigrellaceae bacterium]
MKNVQKLIAAIKSFILMIEAMPAEDLISGNNNIINNPQVIVNHFNNFFCNYIDFSTMIVQNNMKELDPYAFEEISNKAFKSAAKSIPELMFFKDEDLYGCVLKVIDSLKKINGAADEYRVPGIRGITFSREELTEYCYNFISRYIINTSTYDSITSISQNIDKSLKKLLKSMLEYAKNNKNTYKKVINNGRFTTKKKVIEALILYSFYTGGSGELLGPKPIRNIIQFVIDNHEAMKTVLSRDPDNLNHFANNTEILQLFKQFVIQLSRHPESHPWRVKLRAISGKIL